MEDNWQGGVKISELPSITEIGVDDYLLITDVSLETTNKVTVGELASLITGPNSVTSVAGRTGDVVLSIPDIEGLQDSLGGLGDSIFELSNIVNDLVDTQDDYLPENNPTFTGVLTGPTTSLTSLGLQEGAFPIRTISLTGGNKDQFLFSHLIKTPTIGSTTNTGTSINMNYNNGGIDLIPSGGQPVRVNGALSVGTIDNVNQVRNYFGTVQLGNFFKNSQTGGTVQTVGQTLVSVGSGTFANTGGTNVSLNINPTYNQTGTGSNTDLLINRTEAALGSGVQKLFDAQVGGVSKFSIDNQGRVRGTDSTPLTIFNMGYVNPITDTIGIDFRYGNSTNTENYSAGRIETIKGSGGSSSMALRYGANSTTTTVGLHLSNLGNVTIGNGTTDNLTDKLQVTGSANITGNVNVSSVIASNTVAAPIVTRAGSNQTLTFQNNSWSTAGSSINALGGTITNPSGDFTGLALRPTYNQTGTAGSTDLLINRTETAIGSGSHKLIDVQVGGSSKFSVSNTGVIRSYIAGEDLLTVDNTSDGRLRIDATGPHGQWIELVPRGIGGAPNLSAQSAMYITIGGIPQILIDNGYIRPNTSDPIQIRTHNPLGKGLAVRGLASQVGNLQEWQNSSGTALASVDKDGNIVSSGNMTAGFITTSSGGQFQSIFLAGTTLRTAGSNTTLNIQGGGFNNTIAGGVGVNFFSGGNAITTPSGLFTGVSITPTYNQTGTAGATDLLINRTETVIGSGSHRLIDAQVGGVSRFIVSNTGNVSTNIGQTSGTFSLGDRQFTWSAGNPLLYSGGFHITQGLTVNSISAQTSGQNFMAGGLRLGNAPIDANYMLTAQGNANFYKTYTNGNGSSPLFSISPIYNQTGTAGGTDLLINRTETAIGSGIHRLIDAQVSGVSQFNVTNTGSVNAQGSYVTTTGSFITTTGNFSTTTGDIFAGGSITGNTGLFNKGMRAATTADYTGTAITAAVGINPASNNFISKLTAKLGLSNIVAWAWDLVNNGTSYDNNLVLDRGNVGIGVAPTIAGYSGVLNLPSATTANQGLWFGTDTNLYRSAANNLKTDDTFTAPEILVNGDPNYPLNLRSSGSISDIRVPAGGALRGGIINPDGSFQGPVFQFWGNSSGLPGQMYFDYGNQPTSAAIFRSGAGGAVTERMRMNVSGNMLIGTATDNGVDKLQVNGGINAPTLNMTTSSGKKLLLYPNDYGLGIGFGSMEYFVAGVGKHAFGTYASGSMAEWLKIEGGNTTLNLVNDGFLKLNNTSGFNSGYQQVANGNYFFQYNSRYSGGGFVYDGNGGASLIQATASGIYFCVAPTGVAGNALTYNYATRMFPSGNMVFANDSHLYNDTGSRLQVTGNIEILNNGGGIKMRQPDGTVRTVTLNNSGVLVVT